MTYASKDDLEKAELFTREQVDDWVKRLYESSCKPPEPLTTERFEAVKKAIIERASELCLNSLKARTDYVVSLDVFKKFVDAGIIDRNGNILDE